jgi:hypothetical protein
MYDAIDGTSWDAANAVNKESAEAKRASQSEHARNILR